MPIRGGNSRKNGVRAKRHCDGILCISEDVLCLDAAIAGINYDAIRAEQEQKFQAALQGGEYAAIIKVFNCKDISTSIGHFFEIDNKAYCSLVIALLHGDKHDDIVNALVPYLPTDIPR